MTISDEDLQAMSLIDLRGLNKRVADALRTAEQKHEVEQAYARFDYKYTLRKFWEEIHNLKVRYGQLVQRLEFMTTEESIARVLARHPDYTRESYLENMTVKHEKIQFEERGRGVNVGLGKVGIFSSYPRYHLATLQAHAGFQQLAQKLSDELGFPVTFGNADYDDDVRAAGFYAEVPLARITAENTPA